MKHRHLSSELAFYNNGYSDNETRRERNYAWEMTPSKIIIELVNSNDLNKGVSSKRVLDLGCGDGRHSKYFSDLGYEVVGIDFSNEAIKICKNRLRNRKNCRFYVADLTKNGVLARFGKFDIVLDWSVLDHIRQEYLGAYVKNVFNSIAQGGCLFLAEFDESLPGVFKNKKYKITNGHYCRSYSIKELTELFPSLKPVDSRKSVLEDEINNYRFHTVLLQK